MNRKKAIADLQQQFREFISKNFEQYRTSNFLDLIHVCLHEIDGDIDYYNKEVLNITRLDLIDDLAITIATEAFIEKLIDWRENRDWIGPEKFDSDTLENLRLKAQRILRAVNKLSELDRTYSHPVLAISDHLKRNEPGRWNRTKIAKVHIQNLNPTERKDLLLSHGTYDAAVKHFVKYLENHKSELLYP